MSKWQIRDVTFTISKIGSGKKEKYLLVVYRGNRPESEWVRLKGCLETEYEEDDTVGGDDQWSVSFRSEDLDDEDLKMAVFEAVSNAYPSEQVSCDPIFLG